MYTIRIYTYNDRINDDDRFWVANYKRTLLIYMVISCCYKRINKVQM